MTSTVPLDPPYRLSFATLTTETPSSAAATLQLLTERAGRPLAMQLTNDGYTVGALESIVAGALVTYSTADDATTFFVTFPHPNEPDPERKLFTIQCVTAELVGGPHDGLLLEPPSRERHRHVEDGLTYERTGYNPVDGNWVYQLVKQTEKEGSS